MIKKNMIQTNFDASPHHAAPATEQRKLDQLLFPRCSSRDGNMFVIHGWDTEGGEAGRIESDEGVGANWMKYGRKKKVQEERSSTIE